MSILFLEELTDISIQKDSKVSFAINNRAKILPTAVFSKIIPIIRSIIFQTN